MLGHCLSQYCWLQFQLSSFVHLLQDIFDTSFHHIMQDMPFWWSPLFLLYMLGLLTLLSRLSICVNYCSLKRKYLSLLMWIGYGWLFYLWWNIFSLYVHCFLSLYLYLFGCSINVFKHTIFYVFSLLSMLSENRKVRLLGTWERIEI